MVWPSFQVAALPLIILQLGTSWLGHTIASALFPHPWKGADQKPSVVSRRQRRYACVHIFPAHHRSGKGDVDRVSPVFGRNWMLRG